MKWVKDPKAESCLKELKIPFDTEEVHLKDIDRDESLRRQTRLAGRINEDWVVEYAEGMVKPEAAFPMTILQKWKKGVYFVWSGNHRIEAARLCEFQTVSAYVVCVTDPRIQDILSRIVNTVEGHRSERKEMVINAKYLIEKHSVPVKDAARIFGLRPEWLYAERRAENTRERIAKLGVSASKMPSTLLVNLCKIDNDNTLKSTADLIGRLKVKGQQAIHIVDDVLSKKTELQQMGVLADWERSITERNKPDKIDLPYEQRERSRLLGLLTSLERFLSGHETLSQAQIVTPADKATVKKKANRIIQVLSNWTAE